MAKAVNGSIIFVHPCYWWIVKVAEVGEVLPAQAGEVARDIAHIPFCAEQVSVI
jgi:hypothetical protein